MAKHWTDRQNPEFEHWWATKTAEGYQYGREALENVRFGFEGAQELREWQPIESAPLDGTAILVYGPGLLREMDGNCAVVRWGGLEHSSIKWWQVHDGKHGPFDLRGPSPTHWMPLPICFVRRHVSPESELIKDEY